MIYQNHEIENTDIKKNTVAVLFAICVAIPVIFAIIIYADLTAAFLYKSRDIASMTVQAGSSEETGAVRYGIEGVDSEDNAYVIRGWLHKVGENMGYVNNRVLLYDTVTDEYIGLPTQAKDKEIIEELYGNEFNYREGGVYSRINKNKLVPGHIYEVCLLYGSEVRPGEHTNNILVKTGDTIVGEAQ